MAVDLFDTANITDGEPSSIISGDLLRWRRTDVSDTYGVSLYDLVYTCRLGGNGANSITITATSDATGFYIDEASLDTAKYDVGLYYWQAHIVRKADDERILIDSGQWTVLADLSSDTSDPRSHALRMINMLEAVLENRATNDVIYYMIGGRAISKIPLSELRKILNDYRNEYADELNADRLRSGKASNRKITVRFT